MDIFREQSKSKLADEIFCAEIIGDEIFESSIGPNVKHSTSR